MPGLLQHSAADVTRRLLIDLGLGTDPDDNDAWPIRVHNEPSTPDACITVYDTTGRTGKRSMPDGENLEYDAVQMRVRAGSHMTGWRKAKQIKNALETQVRQDEVVIGADLYKVWAYVRIGSVLSLGNDGESKRKLFTVNAEVSIRQIN